MPLVHLNKNAEKYINKSMNVFWVWKDFKTNLQVILWPLRDSCMCVCLTLDPSLYSLWVLLLTSGCVSGKCPPSTLFNMCLDCFSPVRVVSMSLLRSKIRQIRCFVLLLCEVLVVLYAFNFKCMSVLILSYQSDVFFRVSAHEPSHSTRCKTGIAGSIYCR